MATNGHEPADTRSMGIVHSALRRDLERTRMVLTDQPYPDAEQRRALASHLGWTMHFLNLLAPKGLRELGAEAHWGDGAAAKVPSLQLSTATKGQ